MPIAWSWYQSVAASCWFGIVRAASTLPGGVPVLGVTVALRRRLGAVHVDDGAHLGAVAHLRRRGCDRWARSAWRAARSPTRRGARGRCGPRASGRASCRRSSTCASGAGRGGRGLAPGAWRRGRRGCRRADRAGRGAAPSRREHARDGQRVDEVGEACRGAARRGRARRGARAGGEARRRDGSERDRCASTRAADGTTTARAPWPRGETAGDRMHGDCYQAAVGDREGEHVGQGPGDGVEGAARPGCARRRASCPRRTEDRALVDQRVVDVVLLREGRDDQQRDARPVAAAALGRACRRCPSSGVAGAAPVCCAPVLQTPAPLSASTAVAEG